MSLAPEVERLIEEAMTAVGGAHYHIVSRAIMEPILRDLVRMALGTVEADAASKQIGLNLYEERCQRLEEQARALAETADVMLDDLRQLLDALGKFSGARPESPHVLMIECIEDVKRLRAARSLCGCGGVLPEEGPSPDCPEHGRQPSDEVRAAVGALGDVLAWIDEVGAEAKRRDTERLAPARALVAAWDAAKKEAGQ